LVGDLLVFILSYDLLILFLPSSCWGRERAAGWGFGDQPITRHWLLYSGGCFRCLYFSKVS